jgi:hypothetical protein
MKWWVVVVEQWAGCGIVGFGELWLWDVGFWLWNTGLWLSVGGCGC